MLTFFLLSALIIIFEKLRYFVYTVKSGYIYNMKIFYHVYI